MSECMYSTCMLLKTTKQLKNYHLTEMIRIMCTIDTRDRVSIDTGDRHLDRYWRSTPRSTRDGHSINILVDPRSTLCQPSVDTRSTSRLTDFQFSLTLYGVAVDTSDDHTFDVGRRVDRYLAVSCQ